jgi:type I restriction enzyme, S subunit
MTLNTLFEKFEQFAEAPNAVKKMRELILQYAVQGKLVPQNPEDEPATDLMVRVAAQLDMGHLVNPMKLEIEQSITQESEYNLPPGWAWLPLGQIGYWAVGCGFPMLHQGELEGEFLFCKVSDMNLPGNEVEIRTTVNRVNTDVVKKLRARPNPPGTVIFPKIGGAIATHKRRLVVRPTIIDNNCSGIQPVGLTDSRWLLLLLQTIDLTKYQAGTSVPAVSQSSLESIRVGLPPLAEQSRVVAKVDELMALCDRLEAQHKERETRHGVLARASLARFADAPTPANLNLLFHKSYTISPAELRNTILTLAVRGQLVPQDAKDEATESWLRLFGTAGQRGTTTNEENGKPHTEDPQHPFSLPTGWSWLRVDDVFEVAGGIQKTPQRAPRSNAFPYLGVGNVYRGRLDLTNVKQFELEEGELDRRKLKAGDLLIIEGNGSFNEIGRCAKWNGEIPNCVHQNHVIRCRPVDVRIASFVLLFLNSPAGTEIMQRLAITSSGLYSLSVGKIRQIQFPLPPLAEQRRIVARVDQLKALVDQLEKQLAAARATATDLMEAVVAELTSQRNDVADPAQTAKDGHGLVSKNGMLSGGNSNMRD